jgi:hypothetical protein
MRNLLFAICLKFIFWQLLDWFFGKGHGSLLRRAELKTLVDLHANEVVLSYIQSQTAYHMIAYLVVDSVTN